MQGLYRQPRKSMDLGLTDVWMVIKFGASGLPVLQVWNQEAQTYSDASNDGGSPATYGPVQNLKIKRTGTGTFLITYGNDGGAPRFFGWGQAIWESATGIHAIDKIGTLSSTRPVTYAGSFTIVTSAAGVATDPTSGEVLKVPVQWQDY
jgi:hypothetical protein